MVEPSMVTTTGGLRCVSDAVSWSTWQFSNGVRQPAFSASHQFGFGIDVSSTTLWEGTTLIFVKALFNSSWLLKTWTVGGEFSNSFLRELF